jgi:hypothetical protein
MKKDKHPIEAIISDDSSVKERILALEKLPPRDLSIDILRKAIRIECQGDWIDKSVQVWNAGAYDSAYLYFWNRAMADLRTKVIAYGLEHLETIVGKTIKDERDLINYLDDKALIDSCFELGIIPEQAWFFLNQAREVRNHYSLAHQFDADIDPIEAVNIIKNCIKYVLAYQVPVPGINLKDVIRKLQTEDIRNNVAEYEATYKEQATKIVNITLNRLFDDLMEEDSNTVYIHNILILGKILWKLSDDTVKKRIGQRVAKIRIEGEPVKIKKSMKFISIVDGMLYVPESMRAAMFNSYSDKLYETCEEPNNFYREEEPAKELHSLGKHIPSESIYSYTAATTLSFIGNQYGYSWSAGDYVKEMIDSWPSSCVDALIEFLDNDIIIIGRLMYDLPAQRFIELLDLIKEKLVDKNTKNKLDMYLKLDERKIRSHFRGKLFKRFEDS